MKGWHQQFVTNLLLNCRSHGWALSPKAPLLSLGTATRTTLPATTDGTEQIATTVKSSVLGEVGPIRLEGEDSESFLKTMAVPTFAANWDESAVPDISQDFSLTKSGGLEGILQQGPAKMIHNVLSEATCNELIALGEELGFGSYRAGKNFHGALQVLVSKQIAEAVGQIICRHINIDEVEERRIEMEKVGTEGSVFAPDENFRLVFAGLNRRWRMYRYAPGKEETFAPHIDAGFPPSGLSEDGQQLLWDARTDESDNTVSRLTVLMYLNDDFVGGETNFFRPVSESQNADSTPLIASVRPRTGSVLVFPQAVGEKAVDYARQHWPLHEGAPLRSGNRPKYVIRSDILFAAEREKLPLEDNLFRHDHLVRNTFMPQSPAMNPSFLSHLSSLYNPHMGVENLGPLLYSLIRFLKVRRVVEIGAGYTSVWILQALKDNDDEMARIQQLHDRGECRLLDIEWAVADKVLECANQKASLLCIDNCEHQKETATGATAVAKSLGLSEYMGFLKGDAFELDLEPNSIDLLWCDFGVGTRMAEFAPGAWKSLRPGGFLLCHSTLTNQGTRGWLEAVRSGEGEKVTGIPPGESLELSLLEPHKRYQNSVTLLQKRRSSNNGEVFEEPIYSQYA